MFDFNGVIVTTKDGVKGRIIGKVEDKFVVETGPGGQIVYATGDELEATIGELMEKTKAAMGEGHRLNIHVDRNTEVEDGLEFTLTNGEHSIDFVTGFDEGFAVYAKYPRKVEVEFENPTLPFPGVNLVSDLGHLVVHPDQIDYTSASEISKTYYSVNFGDVTLRIYGPGAEEPYSVFEDVWSTTLGADCGSNKSST